VLNKTIGNPLENGRLLSRAVFVDTSAILWQRKRNNCAAQRVRWERLLISSVSSKHTDDKLMSVLPSTRPKVPARRHREGGWCLARPTQRADQIAPA